MKFRKVRLWIALLLLIASLILLGASALPVERNRQSVPMPEITLPVPQSMQPSVGEVW